MFNFLKKNRQLPEVKQEATLSDQDIIAIQAQLAEKNDLLTSQLNSQNEDEASIARLYEEMGLLAVNINKDEAINYLENSLTHKLTIGDGYKCLMSLYNQKRAESALNGDNQGIEKWMGKMDEMRQIVKKVIIIG